MMKYLRYAILALIAIALITVALANRDHVTLQLLPDDLARLMGVNHSITLPLFAVIFGGIAAGILIGFIWEWLREHRIRANAATTSRELKRLEREVARSGTAQPKDDVLALLDAPPGKAG